MWSGFSSEIETRDAHPRMGRPRQVACGAASHLRLKQWQALSARSQIIVACGAASHLRLKPVVLIMRASLHTLRRMWSGFSSEIETYHFRHDGRYCLKSHVERLLI